MKTLSNKTRRPLSVPLPRGKTLHLGPGRTGQVGSDAVEYAPLKKMIAAGEIEVVGEGHGGPVTGGSQRIGQPGAAGHAPSSHGRRTGDR